MKMHRTLLQHQSFDEQESKVFFLFQQDNSLTLLWQQVYDNVEGTYTCTLYYLDEENTPLSESKELTFNIKGK